MINLTSPNQNLHVNNFQVNNNQANDPLMQSSRGFRSDSYNSLGQDLKTINLAFSMENDIKLGNEIEVVFNQLGLCKHFLIFNIKFLKVINF